MNSLKPLERNPAPLVEWRNHAAMGKLLQRTGRPSASRQAFQRAARVIRYLTDNITHPELQTAFLGEADVRQVMSEAS